MKKFYFVTEYLYRSTTEIDAETIEEAKSIYNSMRNYQIIGSDSISINDLEDGIIIEKGIVDDDDWYA